MAPLSAHAQGNLLANASFEEGSYVYNNDGDQRVPTAWLPWWVSPPKGDCNNFKPHYELEQHPTHVVDGSTSARYYTAYSTHNGGLMQTVSVTPGAHYRFSIYGFAWSTDNPVVDTPSTSTTKMWAGIDPTGGTDGKSGSVIWSAENDQMDHFNLFTVDAVAQSDHITVFTRNKPDWCVYRNDSFWDAASLVQVGGSTNPVQPTTPPVQPTTPPAQPTQPPSLPPSGVTAHANTTLNIRNGPTVYNDIIGYVPDGETVSVLGRDAGGTQWIFINRNGVKGWIAGWLTTVNGDLNSVPLVDQGGNPTTPPGNPSPGNPSPGNPPVTNVSAIPAVNANMRSGPGVTFSVVATAFAGVSLPVVARDPTSNWILVNKSGTQGWIAVWLCTISGSLSGLPVSTGGTTTPGGGASGPVTATANLTMNIRNGPSTNHAVIGYVPGGETVSVVGRADDSQWIDINRNGVQGWIAGWLCTIHGDLTSLPVTGHTGTAMVTGGSAEAMVDAQSSVTAISGYQLNMRASPDLASQTIAQIPANTVLTATGRDFGFNWLYVSYNGTQGWIARWLVTTTGYVAGLPLVTSGGSAPAQPPSNPPPSGGGAVTATANSSMNIRSGPNSLQSVIGTFYSGTTATVVGRADDSQWIQIQYQSTTGWVAGWLCTINGNLNSVPVTGHTGSGSGGSSPPPAGPPPAAPTPLPPSVPNTPPSGPETFALGGQVPGEIDHPDFMHAARMTWTKMQLDWSPGMDPSAAAGMIAAAHANGFKILLGITGGTYPQSIDFGSYVSFVRGVASYGPDGIEIWNEMNLDREWPTGQISPASYVQFMLAPAYNAIKSVNPNILVVSGALAPTGANDGIHVWADDLYLGQMRDAGAANYMDCLGVHHNAGATPPDATSGHPADPGPHHYSWYYTLTYNLYATTFPTKQLCFTELGYLSPEGFPPLSPNFWWGQNTTVADQAAWLARAVQLARQSGRVRLVIVFNVDFTVYGDDPQAGYAIVRPNNTCPACYTLAAVAP